MELKLCAVPGASMLPGGINRTFMELKQDAKTQEIERYDSINRTFMELKLYLAYQQACRDWY